MIPSCNVDVYISAGYQQLRALSTGSLDAPFSEKHFPSLSFRTDFVCSQATREPASPIVSKQSSNQCIYLCIAEVTNYVKDLCPLFAVATLSDLANVNGTNRSEVVFVIGL